MQHQLKGRLTTLENVLERVAKVYLRWASVPRAVSSSETIFSSKLDIHLHPELLSLPLLCPSLLHELSAIHIQ
jgi:hypothetical protein